MRSSSEAQHRAHLLAIVSSTPWLMDALLLVRSMGLPEWCIGAGSIRSAVWTRLTGAPAKMPTGDIDVAFFDPVDLDRDRDIEISNALASSLPGRSWDVVNQAGVHLWYEDACGESLAPFASLEDAVASWPEVATCVGVYMDDDDSLQLVAPLGLSDLFGLVVRRNPCVSERIYRSRLESKRFDEQWLGITVVP